MSTTLCLAALLFAGESFATAPDLVFASYPLDAIVAPAANESVRLWVLPLPPVSMSPDPSAGPSTAVRRVLSDRILDLVRRVVAVDEWEAPGRSIEIHRRDDFDSLAVAAPAAVHAQVRETLGFLAAHFRREVRVRCQVYSMVDRIEGLESFVGAKDVGARIQEQQDSGTLVPVLDSRLILVAGAPGVASRSIERSFLVDYDVEIAQSAAIHDSIVSTALLGTSLIARADVLSDDEVLLHFAARHAAEKSAARVVDASARVEFAIDSRVAFEQRAPGNIEEPTLEFQLLAGAARLMKGTPVIAFVAPLGAGEGDDRGLLVSFEVESIAAASPHFESGGRVLSIVDLAALLDSGMYVPRFSPHAGGMRTSFEDVEWDGFNSQIVIGHASPPSSGPSVTESFVHHLADQLGESATIEVDSGFLFVVAPTPVADSVARIGSLFGALPSTASLVGTTKVAGDASAPAFAAFAVPLAGRRFAALNGIEENWLVDCDVDVANGAAAANPNVSTKLFGRFLHGTANLDPSNGELVSLSGSSRVRSSAITPIFHNSPTLPRLERAETCSTRFEAAIGFAGNRGAERFASAFSNGRDSVFDLEFKRITR